MVTATHLVSEVKAREGQINKKIRIDSPIRAISISTVTRTNKLSTNQVSKASYRTELFFRCDVFDGNWGVMALIYVTSIVHTIGPYCVCHRRSKNYRYFILFLMSSFC